MGACCRQRLGRRIHAGHFGAEPRQRTRRERPIEFPIVVGSMGQLPEPEASLFDDKLANQAGFGFDAQKGCAA